MIGKKIKQQRTKLGLTMSQLAQSCNISVSFLSQMERDLVEPSIATLRKIAENMQVPLYYFFTQQEVNYYVIKADARQKIGNIDSQLRYEFISPIVNSPEYPLNMVMIAFFMQPHSAVSEEPLSHEGDECVLLTKGTLLIRLPEAEIILYEGDSLYIRSEVPHEFINTTDETVTGISCISPPNINF